MVLLTLIQPAHRENSCWPLKHTRHPTPFLLNRSDRSLASPREETHAMHFRCTVAQTRARSDQRVPRAWSARRQAALPLPPAAMANCAASWSPCLFSPISWTPYKTCHSGTHTKIINHNIDTPSPPDCVSMIIIIRGSKRCSVPFQFRSTLRLWNLEFWELEKVSSDYGNGELGTMNVSQASRAAQAIQVLRAA